ncbi:MAG: hypothetical protein KAS94_01070 [Desulfobulbaceae bacterium]|nr:hypothetical protein [Desulfobulbaceae bacterium]
MTGNKQADRLNNQGNNGEDLRGEMMRTYLAGLMNQENSTKLLLCSPEVFEPIYNGAIRMSPSAIFINNGSNEDIDYIRHQALARGEEKSLVIRSHTYHFDGPDEQGRDTANTKYLAYVTRRSVHFRKKKSTAPVCWKSVISSAIL